MKRTFKKSLLLGVGIGALSLAGCGEDEVTPDPVDPIVDPPVVTGPIAQTIEVTTAIKGDTTWEGQNTYVLKDNIFVESGTLTIQPGAKVVGFGRVSLTITTGAKLNAVGTREKPIVFTSSQPEGQRKPADWGGLVLLGKAPINVQGGTSNIEGFPATQPGVIYGGADAAHDCGKLKYARIEFAGFKLTDANELNGLTMGACGTATEVDYVQVHKGADDGVEMFGGTANLKHILVTQPDDDGLDWDIGYSGKVQYLIVQQNPDVGNCGFESDNNPNNPADATPRSIPTVANVTLIGSNRDPGTAGKKQLGMHLKNGTGGKISSVVMAYFTDLAVDLDKAPAVSMYNAGELFIRNSLFWDNKNFVTEIGNESTDNDGGFDESARLIEAVNANRVADPMLTDALNLTQPSFLPKAGSPALSGGVTPSDAFFESNTFVGAMGTDDWTAGWTAFPAN